jgi:hypothetical protein
VTEPRHTTVERPSPDGETAERLWVALRQVRTLEFAAHSRGNTGWTGRGTGTVTVEAPTADSLIFHESGFWHSETSKSLEFRNIYRWTRTGDTVRLEHLRFGEQHPVYLFDLAPAPERQWASVAPHVCRADEYTARLRREESGIVLVWKITGPEKNEEITYQYR